nr:Tx-1072 [Heteropoda pingtungensis]
MLKFVLVLGCLFAVVYSFAVEKEGLPSLEADAPEAARAKSLPEGAPCDGDKDDCQCYGKWHKCRCPWFWEDGPCRCAWGLKHTCITKLSCPNKGEWGLDWRNGEERSPC